MYRGVTSSVLHCSKHEVIAKAPEHGASSCLVSHLLGLYAPVLACAQADMHSFTVAMAFSFHAIASTCDGSIHLSCNSIYLSSPLTPFCPAS